MSRAFSLTLAWAFIVVGLGGVALGLWRIAVDGDVMRGLANLVVGGLVACLGEGNRQDAQ